MTTIADFLCGGPIRRKAGWAQEIRETIVEMSEEELINSPLYYGKSKQQMLEYLDKRIHYRSVLQ